MMFVIFWIELTQNHFMKLFENYSRLINLLTFCWDAIRIFALKDEEAQGWFSGTGERDISRTQEEQEEMDRKCIDFAKYLWELVQRHTDDY